MGTGGARGAQTAQPSEVQPGCTCRSARQLVDELAEDTDDNIEDIDARSDDDEHDDEDADRFDWLEDTYDLTAEQLAEALQELDPEDAQAAVDGLEELYRLHRQGYGTEAAEQLYLAQLDSGDSAGDADAGSYADAE